MSEVTKVTETRRPYTIRVHTPVRSFMVRVTYFVFGAIEILIAIRFGFKLLGANAASGVVKMVYATSDYFMIIFNSIFKTREVDGVIFEWSALVAILAYALLAWGIVALIDAFGPTES